MKNTLKELDSYLYRTILPAVSQSDPSLRQMSIEIKGKALHVVVRRESATGNFRHDYQRSDAVRQMPYWILLNGVSIARYSQETKEATIYTKQVSRLIASSLYRAFSRHPSVLKIRLTSEPVPDVPIGVW